MATILILEDHEVLQATMSKALQAAGHIVLTAPDGKRAAQVVRSARVDLLITDLFMPEKEGLETIEEIRQSYPTLKIIAISAGGPMDQNLLFDLAKKMGANAALPKPFQMQELRDLVGSVLAEA